MNMMTKEEFKKTFLDLLKKDEEFRLAVAGLIGLEAILNELKKLHEKSLEHKRFEAIEKKLLEHDEKFREILEEIKRIWEKIAELNRRLSHVEDNVGALTEATLS